MSATTGTASSSLVETFCELVAIPSPSGREAAVAAYIAERLSSAGIASAYDGTGAQVESECGNLVATLPGAGGLPHLLFISHMDTVQGDTDVVVPEIVDGVIRPSGATILGADNKGSVASTLHLLLATAELPEDRRPTVSVAFTCNEERGVMGASVLDLAAIGADCIFSVDGALPAGTVISKALGQRTFTIEVTGRTAHAAESPESGVDAIAAVAAIVAELDLGRQEHGGSLNIGAVIGGSIIGATDSADTEFAMRHAATNSVPDKAWLRGEARAFTAEDLDGTLAQLQRKVDEVAQRTGARAEVQFGASDGVPPFTAREGGAAATMARRAIEATPGAEYREITYQACFEANYLGTGGDVIALATGGHHSHSKRDLTRPDDPYEYLAVAELELLHTLLVQIVAEAAAA